MAESNRDWEGDWIGSCRVCWNVRNLGPSYKPGAEAICLRTNPDGSQCQGRLLVSKTKEAQRRVAALRRQKRAEQYKR